jgi:hypothetical protein
MLITRRQWLSISAGSAYAAWAFPGRVEAQDGAAGPVERRISRIITECEQQGFHRTGTAVDKLSGDWLCEEVREAGLAPTLESFSLSRVDSVTNVLVAGERRIEGVPLFDGAFTDARGVRGRLGSLESDAEIGLAETATNAAASGPLGDARRTNRHKAIVAITRGGRPGLCPSNADSFLQPFGPPVLQLSSEEALWLRDQAERRVEVQLIAQITRTVINAVNVTATINGANPALPPLIVMTPRSGWYSCASERGGGIACWLEVMRAPYARSRRLAQFCLWLPADTNWDIWGSMPSSIGGQVLWQGPSAGCISGPASAPRLIRPTPYRHPTMTSMPCLPER